MQFNVIVSGILAALAPLSFAMPTAQIGLTPKLEDRCCDEPMTIWVQTLNYGNVDLGITRQHQCYNTPSDYIHTIVRVNQMNQPGNVCAFYSLPDCAAAGAGPAISYLAAAEVAGVGYELGNVGCNVYSYQCWVDTY